MNKLELLKKLKEESNPAFMAAKSAEKQVADAIEKLSSFQRSIKGDQGEPGYTPVKGKDYFTDIEITNIINYVQSKVKDGENGTNGTNGVDGNDGKTPIREIDYWTKEDREKILKDVLAQIPKPTKEKPLDVNDIIKKVSDGIPQVNYKEEIGKILKSPGFRMLMHGGGLNIVTHDTTLSGDGTPSSPLGVIASALSPLTTKGDIYTFSNVNARLPVGTDAKILVADSTQITGLKWQTLDETIVLTPLADQIGSPTTLLNLDQQLDHMWSAGMTDGAMITDNGNGTVNVAAGLAVLRRSLSATITRSGSTATATTASNHGYQTGDTVWILGAVQTQYNGNYQVTVTGLTTFTYQVTGAPATPATGTILTVDEHSELFYCQVAAQANIALTDHSTNYIHVDYNGGSPLYSVGATISDFNCLDKCLVYTIAREGTLLYIVTATGMNVDGNRKDRRRLFETQGFQHVTGGSILSASGTRNIGVTAGAFYYAYQRIAHNAFDTSGSDTFTYVYRNATPGVWNYVTSQTQINNTQYDDGSGALATLSGNNYAVHWVYMMNNNPSSLLVQYGQAGYPNEAQAQAATVPTAPNIVSGVGALIGRIIIQKSAAAFTAVDSAFQQVFIPSAATNHNLLAGLQGGTLNEYYHLTSTEYTGTGTGIFVRTSTPTIATPNITTGLTIGGVAATGTILRANGTNYVASTMTYPDTITSGYIPYATGTNVLGSSADLQYNGSGNFDLRKDQNSETINRVINITAGTGAYAGYIGTLTANNATNLFHLIQLSPSYTTSGMLVAGATALMADDQQLNIFTYAAKPLVFGTNNAERIRVLSTGEFLIGNTTRIGNEMFLVQKDQNAGTFTMVYNATSGTAALASYVAKNAGGHTVEMGALSALYTTSGIYVQSTSYIASNQLAGMNIGTTSATQLSFWTNNTERARFLSTGELIVGSTALYSGELFGIRKNQNASTYAVISNTTSGTGSQAALFITSKTSLSDYMGLYSLSAAYTTAGMFVQDAAVLVANKAAGFNIGTNTATQLSFWTNNTERARFLSTGEFLVGSATAISTELMLLSRNQNAPTTLRISNTTSGTAGRGSLVVIGGIAATYIDCTSALYTPSGIWTASTSVFTTDAVAGMNIGTYGATQLSFWTNNTKRMSIAAAGAVDISNGTTAASVPAFKVTATLEQTAHAQGVVFNITTAGSAAFQQIGSQVSLIAGYTGAKGTRAARFDNAVAGTGVDPWTTGDMNTGFLGTCSATTVGMNIGAIGMGYGSSTNAFGVLGYGYDDAVASSKRIGVAGFATNTGASGIAVGGYFGLQAATPTFTTAALMCDNGAVAADIFVARDNGTAVFTIGDGGTLITIAPNATTLSATGTGANGLKIKNLKNSTNTTVSGTAKTVEIDIAGTPYYFLVYPTSSA